MDTGDWRAQLQPDSRQRIVNKIVETLKRHLPFSGQEGLLELKKIAVRFEEKIYTTATSQSDYLRKISLKMLTMENKSQNTISNPANGTKPPVPGASHSLQPEVHNQADDTQAQQLLFSQNLPSMQQSLTQIPQVHSHDTQMNPQVQTMNMQGSVSGVQQNNMSSLQLVSSICGAPISQQNTMQPESGSNMDFGQGNATSSLWQVTLPQNSVSVQQPNINNLSSPSAVNMLQPNTAFKSNTDMSQLSQPLLKLQTQEVMQKMPQQQKQQLPAQGQTPQILKMHQKNDGNEMKVRQEMGFNNKKLAGLQAQAPLLAIVAFILFVLCLLFLVSVMNLWLVLSH